MKLNSSIHKVLKGAILLGASLPVAIASFAQASFISHTPSQVEAMVGDTFSIFVHVHADAEPLSVIDVHMLFDNEFLQVLDVVPGEGSSFSYHVPPSFSNESGKIDMSAFKFGDEVLNGQLEVMKVTFQALEETPLTEVSHPMNVFPKSLLAYRGENKLNNTTDLFVTILSAETVSTDNSQADVSTLAVWPNPAQNETSLSFNLNTSGQVTLCLFDNIGKEIERVFEGNAMANTDYRFELPVGKYASGTYSVRLQTKHEVKSTLLIVGK